MTETKPDQSSELHLAIIAAHPGRLGGMEKFSRFVGQSALSANWRVTVALSGQDIYQDLAPQARLAIEKVDWLDRTWGGDRRYQWQLVGNRWRWFRRVRPDVALFVQSSNTPFRASVLAARLAGVPIVTTHRTMAWPVEDSARGRYLWGLVPGLGLHRKRVVFKTWLTAALAHRVVYNSHQVRRGYECHYRYPRRKGVVIVNAAKMTHSCVSNNVHQGTYGVRDPSAMTIGYVGRLSREKRIDILIRALASLRTQRTVKLAFYGDGPERQNLSILASELGVRDRVEFRGPTDDVWSAYDRCDCVVLCSPRESSSNMVLEAMAAGKAVIVTRVGGLPELTGYGRFGLCVPPLDVKALADALARLIEDDALRANLGERASQAVLAGHDPAMVSPTWLDVLREAAGSPVCVDTQDIMPNRTNAHAYRLAATRRGARSCAFFT